MKLLLVTLKKANSWTEVGTLAIDRISEHGLELADDPRASYLWGLTESIWMNASDPSLHDRLLECTNIDSERFTILVCKAAVLILRKGHAGPMLDEARGLDEGLDRELNGW